MNDWEFVLTEVQKAAGVRPQAARIRVDRKHELRSRARIATLRGNIVAAVIKYPGSRSNELAEHVKPKTHVSIVRELLTKLFNEGIITRHATVDNSNKHYAYFIKKGNE